MRGVIKIDDAELAADNTAAGNTAASNTAGVTGPQNGGSGEAENLPRTKNAQRFGAVSLLALGLLAAIVVATIIAYSPVLFNFFVGDDFVHLAWLKDAIHQPEMIWRNFHSSWLDGTTTKFYRPLISVFMVTDYWISGTNGTMFHITNLLFHLASSILLFFIVRDIARVGSQPGKSSGTRWALASAAVFALYPLHPETVSWITGRVDAIVTTFCLGTFFCYVRWRDTKALGWIAASISSFILALLSKEMAITIPPVLVAYEVLIGDGNSRPNIAGSMQDGGSRPNIADSGLAAVKRALCTTPFFFVLAGYFVVRRMALGTFVGGYDDSLFFIADIKSFLLNWIHALRMMVVPLNRDLFGSHDALTKTWEIFTIASVVLCFGKVIRAKFYWRQFLFAGSWLVLCLLPVYKIFAIADDLQGSRLAYLATVPLSILFAYGLTAFTEAKSLRSAALRNAPITLFVALCTIVLWTNNQPWKAAGEESNAIRAGLQTIYGQTSDDPQTLFLGMPDQIHGAYVCRNAVTGMTKKPQLSRDINNCLLVNQFEPILPFGFLKRSLVAAGDAVRIYRWSSADKSFVPVAKNSASTGGTPVLSRHIAAAELRSIIAPVEDGSTKLSWSEDGTLAVDASAPNKRAAFIMKMDRFPCWQTDFVAMNVAVDKPGQPGVGADLLYANDISPEFFLPRRTHSETGLTSGRQTWLFPLHALPEWAFGGNPARLKLLTPTGASIKLESVSLIAPELLIPKLNFDNSGYMGTKGYLHLGKDRPQRTVTIDATAIPQAASTEIEITRANLLFEEQNCTHFSKIAGSHYRAPLKGDITLKLNDFPAGGIYELRVWARNKADALVGLCSDHIVLAVDR